MSKKIYLSLLCLIVLLGVCGCGNNSDLNNEKENIKINENTDDNRVENNTSEDVKENEKVDSVIPNKNNDKNDKTNNNTVVDKDNNIVSNKDDNNIENDNKVEPIQEEIAIIKEDLYDFFEIKNVDIILELNAFAERGTEDDFYYTLVLSLKILINKN